VSVTDRVKTFALGHGVGSLHDLAGTFAFVGTDEAVSLVAADGSVNRVEAASGGILCAVTDGKSKLILGTDDGRVIAVDAKGGAAPLATDAKRRWIDSVAVHADGSIAYSAGKTAFVKPAKGDTKSLDVPSTVGGLAFAPKGFRVAIAHYNGVTLWFPNMAGSG